MSAFFYAEDLGIDINDAEKIATFMEIAAQDPFVTAPAPWARHGKVRVYFEPWSQNSLMVFRLANRWFYDCHEDDVFAQGYSYKTLHLFRLSELVTFKTGNFSGAKTKARLVAFAEKFYEQKATRNRCSDSIQAADC